jgi:hypothetical protein
MTLLYQHDGRLDGSDRVKTWAEIVRRMRTVVSVSPCSPDTSDLRLRVIRTDAGLPDPLRIRIEEGVPVVVHGSTVQARTAVDRAAEFLEQHLASGATPALPLIAAAKLDRGISRRSLDRAKRRLGIRSFRTSDRWMWIVPPWS